MDRATIENLKSGDRIRHRDGDVFELGLRKDDGSGWWLSGSSGGGLSDLALEDAKWSLAEKMPSLELLARVFEEWDRRYRDDPSSFFTDVEHLLGNTPESYGEAAAIYFSALLEELDA